MKNFNIIIQTNPQALIFPKPSKPAINVGTRNKPKYYLSLYGGYDVETTTTITFEGARACVYSHAIALANEKDCYLYLFRTWEDFNLFIEKLIVYYELNTARRVILWVANLSFEFSFLENRFEWDEVFAKETRQPLLASYSGVDFRECLTISGGGLAYLAKTYCHTQKLVGELDYSKPRNYKTELTKTELEYIKNDVIILAEFSKYIFMTYIRKRRFIPMTSTGILLSDLKISFKTMCKDLNAPALYQRYIQKNFPGEEDYYFYFRFLFRGGYVHGNALYNDVDLPSVDMKDITSSYPFVMLADYVPREKFKSDIFSEKALKEKCCIIYATFKNIHITTHHTIESKNKIIDVVGGAFDNGRLIYADLLRVCLTELDLDIYKKFYSWESLEINSFFTSPRSTLPKFLIDNLLKAYKKKALLKKSGQEDTQEYKLIKPVVNGFYGMCVKRIRLDTITFEGGEWITKKSDKDYSKEAFKNLLLPTWGIWITAHARHHLLTTIYALEQAGVTVIYSDTDSIKYISNSRAKKIFKKYNLKTKQKLYKRGYRSEVFDGLGMFSAESDKPVRFKCLGAKRYIYFNEKKNKVIATVAGMPKEAINMVGTTPDEIFMNFSAAGFSLNPEKTNKMRPVYCDTPYDLYISGEWCHEKSGCALVNVPFGISKITIKEEFEDFCNTLQDRLRIGDTV